MPKQLLVVFSAEVLRLNASLRHLNRLPNHWFIRVILPLHLRLVIIVVFVVSDLLAG